MISQSLQLPMKKIQLRDKVIWKSQLPYVDKFLYFTVNILIFFYETFYFHFTPYLLLLIVNVYKNTKENTSEFEAFIKTLDKSAPIQ